MFWFIIFMLIFVIVASIVDFSCNGWTITKQFFTDSVWGIIAIASGILALILFYASSKSYKDVKINESFLPNPKRDKNKKGKPSMSLIKKENGVVEYDLSQLTMSTLTKKMAYEMTKPGPVFFKGWGNSRLLLDVERVRILQQYIDSIRSTGESLMELQADAFLSYEKIKALTEEKRYQFKKRVIDSKIALDFAKEEYTHKLEMLRLERESISEDIKIKRAQREKIETDNIVTHLKAEAEYKLIIAKSEKEKQIAFILAEAVKYYKDLPNVLKSYVAVQLGSDNSLNPSVDMELQDQLKDFIIRKHKAETEMIENEADENKALTDTMKVKLEREKKKYIDNGKV
jgi:hypothetical protein